MEVDVKEREAFRLTEDDRGRLARLAIAWGGVTAAKKTDVFREALIRAEKGLTAEEKKRLKKSD